VGRKVTAPDARRDWGDDDAGCTVLHVDMDAFYASVELLRRPELRGQPVIVAGEGRSVVLAATYEARAFGVHAAMSLPYARRLCPRAVVIPPDHRRYAEISAGVMAVLHGVTELVEQVSIDEAFLDVAGAVRRLGSPTRIAQGIRAQVRERFGVTCSVGVASTKFVAKLAAGMAKPDGMLLVPRGATVDFLHSLPVGALWGVGERTQAALARWGITTVAELARTDVPTLQRAVGKATGAHLHDLAWGRDPRPVTPVRQEKSVGSETTFESDLRDPAAVQAQVLAMADRCARHLRAKQLVGRTVGLKVRTADFTTVTRSRTLAAPTDVAAEIYAAARDLLATVDLGGLAVRLVGVRMEGLAPAAVRQPTLEEVASDDPEARRRAEEVADAVRRRFGARAVVRGATLDRSGSQLPPPAVANYPEGH
jgi:DNA polymerase-4